MKNLYKILTLVIVCLLSQSCNDYPVDDNGLLVTDSEECYISSLILRGPDDRDSSLYFCYSRTTPGTNFCISQGSLESQNLWIISK